MLIPSFSLPVGSEGARASVAAAVARFRALRGGAALELRGDYERWNASLLQPILRGASHALNADYSLQRTSFSDNSIFGQLQRRRISGASINLSGLVRSAESISRASLDLKRGIADLSGNAADLATDSTSSRIDGGFWRLRWTLGYEQPLASGTVVLKANGQWANRNLDATQKFALGGTTGVRAYPTAEALGDGGWIAGAEWRRPLGGDIDGRLFADTGNIQRNARPWANQRNRYDLSSLGAGLTWRLPGLFRFDVDAARQIGGNPGRNADGTDSDGRQARWRLWLALSREF
jgi:hemolysin activation/secretion protein